jgi:cell wall-associated NlpC family hydrolase
MGRGLGDHSEGELRVRTDGKIRGGIAAVVMSAACLTTLPAAHADGNHTFPSKNDVDAAQRQVAKKARDVGAIQADLAAADQQLDRLRIKAEIAVEAYNGAMYRLEQARKAARLATAKAQQSAHLVAAERDRIGGLVASAYQSGSVVQQFGMLLQANGTQTLLSQFSAAASAQSSLNAEYDAYSADNTVAHVYQAEARRALAARRAAAVRAAKMKKQAAAAVAAQERAVARIDARKHDLIAELAKAQHISVELAEKRQAALERIRKKRAEAAAEAAAAAQAHHHHGSHGGPASSGNAQKAIDFAYAQLGEPYVWAAAGPDAWDCSGLTMGAWGAADVYLPHYSVDQYAQSQHISESELRPGDLVFWASSPRNPRTIFHVGLYIGGGDMIAAPAPGEYVRVENIYSWEQPDFFARP